MSRDVLERANGECELCAQKDDLEIVKIEGAPVGFQDEVLLCKTCRDGISDPKQINEHHWRCLTDAMWKPTPVIQVLSAQLLTKLDDVSWAQDAKDMLYLDDELNDWVASGLVEKVIHRDANGAILQAGDNVTIIKDLDVKGTSFVAKRGTPVRGISLTDNPTHIEGKVNGTRIVILTQYVKKN